MKNRDFKERSVKSQLIEQIQGIADEAFLQALKVIVESKTKSAAKPAKEGRPDLERYELSTFEHVKLRPAQIQYQTGEHTPHEEINKDIDAWLKGE